ncbi:MAG: deoxyribonuclease-4 [Chloroflexi bacterium]|nr:MAG: deoxyribonuclease-4 [Chloroflexota bacterium]
MKAEAVQVFGAAPQQWRRKTHPQTDIDAFREGMTQAGIGPNFMHGIYLVNLATADSEHLTKGIASLSADMQLAGGLGVAGVIFHVGSHKGAGFDAVLPQIAQAIREVLAESPPNVWLCLENNAGGGDSIGSRFAELGAIREAVGNDRVRVCFDTCHAHAAGYDLTDAAALDEAMAEFDREVGSDALVAVHANDSKTPLGSGRDRHENVGWGTIGVGGFRNLLAFDAFRSATWLLEVPGYEGGGPDALNLRVLKALREGKRLPRIPKKPEGGGEKTAKKATGTVGKTSAKKRGKTGTKVGTKTKAATKRKAAPKSNAATKTGARKSSAKKRAAKTEA